MTAYCISKSAGLQWDFEKTCFFRKNRKHMGIGELLKGGGLDEIQALSAEMSAMNAALGGRGPCRFSYVDSWGLEELKKGKKGGPE